MSASGKRAALRQVLRAARTDLAEEPRQLAISSIGKHLQAILLQYKPDTLAAYLSVGGEVDLGDTLRAARSLGITTVLPVLDDRKLLFARVDDATELIANRFGIDEPALTPFNQHAPDTIDLVLLPLVGFDAACNRLGMGGGFYDRTFAFRRESTGATRPRLVGVAFDCQQVDDVHADWWDVPLDAVVTESGTCGQSTG